MRGVCGLTLFPLKMFGGNVLSEVGGDGVVVDVVVTVVVEEDDGTLTLTAHVFVS